VWSDFFTTHAPRSLGVSSLKDSPFVFGVVGDNGVSPHSHRVAAQLALEQNTSVSGSRAFEMLVHPGDISYANGIQHYWDEWGNMVQPFAAYRPWMVAPGNHEIFDAFVPYLYRFKMPSKESGAKFGNMYYSWNIGPVHLIALNSESLEFWHTADPMEQYEWLKADLASVDRTVTPWVMSFWHTPWYCSNTHHQGSGNDMKDSYEEVCCDVVPPHCLVCLF
jgi:Calcineurin-like phosphoesterase